MNVEKNKMLINITYRLLWRIIKGMRIIARCFVLKRAVALKNEPLCKPSRFPSQRRASKTRPSRS